MPQNYPRATKAKTQQYVLSNILVTREQRNNDTFNQKSVAYAKP